MQGENLTHQKKHLMMQGPSESFDDALTHIIKEGGNDLVQYFAINANTR